MPRLSVLEVLETESDAEAFVEEFRPRVPSIDETILAERINEESSGEAIAALFVTVVCGAIVGIAYFVNTYFGTT